MKTLNVIRLPGLNTDCLGNYLAALGVLAAVAKQWPHIRGCWINGSFALLSDKLENLDSLHNYLCDKWKRTPYEHWWTTAQKADTKAKSAARIRLERSGRSTEEVGLLDSHIVATGRNVFNPVLGTGGNVGKRNLLKGFNDAEKLLKKPDAGSWLHATLIGSCEVALPKLNNGGTWFVYSNKTFNSGRKWFQEGLISPWSILLATEGALLLSGGVNRRLSSKSRPYAVFPFISEPKSPESAGEVGAVTAEFWAPIWSHPATLGELRAILKRGFAQLGNRTAKAPHEFAVAAMTAGVDAGIAEFARFELRQTTSSQVYEAIPKPHISVTTVPDSENGHQPSAILMELANSGWLDSLPFEPHDSKQRGKFTGLRGPIETAILRIAERPKEHERWRELLLRLVAVQTKIDRNQRLRKACSPVPPLSRAWLNKAWESPVCPEIELAAAIASLGAVGNGKKTVFNIFGLTGRFTAREPKVWFPDARPAQAVWNTGAPLQTLLKVAQRRLIDADAKKPSPFSGSYLCSFCTVRSFLEDDLDMELIATWLPALSLIDWSSNAVEQPNTRGGRNLGATASVFALLKPFFHGSYSDQIQIGDRHLLERADRKPGSQFLRKIFLHLRFNEIDQAIDIALARYRANNLSIVRPPTLQADGERIAAALMIPMSRFDVANGLKHWLQPVRSLNR